MPEGRMLKKLISTSQKLAKLKSDSARLLYTWLLPHLDIEGRFSADPNIVKGYVVPRLKMSPRKINDYLEDMVRNDLIIIYEINGDKFLQLKKFKDFQILREKRESKSQIPAPPKNSITTPGVPTENSSTSKVKESKSKVKESKSLCLEKFQDEDIRLTQLLIDLMTENNPNSSILRRLTPKRQEIWIDECRKLREIDKRNAEQIEQIIIFSQNDSFWKSNILSMPKLREKFDQLWLKAKKQKFSGIREWLNEA